MNTKEQKQLLVTQNNKNLKTKGENNKRLGKN